MPRLDVSKKMIMIKVKVKNIISLKTKKKIEQQFCQIYKKISLKGLKPKS